MKMIENTSGERSEKGGEQKTSFDERSGLWNFPNRGFSPRSSRSFEVNHQDWVLSHQQPIKSQ